jgi:membrane protein
MDRHNVAGLSAQISYYFALALFPFLIVLGVIVGMLASTHLWDDVLRWITDHFPHETQAFVFQTVASLTQGRSRFLSVGLAGTAWAAAGGLMNLMSALNAVYGVKETRSYLKRLGTAFLMLFVLLLLVLGTFGLLSTGYWLDQWLRPQVTPGVPLAALAQAGRWATSIMVAIISITWLDHALPNRKRPWRWFTPGAVVVVTGWILFSYGFNRYVRYIASYHKTYGVVGGFVILMVWMYVASLIALLGAEINSELGSMRAEGGDAGSSLGSAD